MISASKQTERSMFWSNIQCCPWSVVSTCRKCEMSHPSESNQMYVEVKHSNQNSNVMSLLGWVMRHFWYRNSSNTDLRVLILSNSDQGGYELQELWNLKGTHPLKMTPICNFPQSDSLLSGLTCRWESKRSIWLSDLFCEIVYHEHTERVPSSDWLIRLH